MCGLLMGLSYGSEKLSDRCASVLCAMMQTPAQADTLRHIAAYRDFKDGIAPDELARTMEQAFGRRALERSRLQANALKLLASPVLTVDTKKKLLQEKAEGDTYTELPLSITEATPFEPVFELDGSAVLNRPEEARRIVANLSLIDVRDSIAYKPLLLVCRDAYVLSEYKRLLSATFGHRKVGYLDASDPNQPLLAEGKANAIIRTLDKLGDAASVIFIENCDELDEREGKEFVKFLRSDYLRNHLVSPSAAYDLSAMLPILLASSEPCEAICQACEKVELQPVAEEEARPIIDRILSDKARIFKLEALEMTPDARERLEDRPIPEVSELLDRAISRHRRDGRRITLTADSFAFDQDSHHTTTFWGRKI